MDGFFLFEISRVKIWRDNFCSFFPRFSFLFFLITVSFRAATISPPSFVSLLTYQLIVINNTLFQVWAKLLAWNYFYFQVSLRYLPFVCRSLTNNVPSRNYKFFSKFLIKAIENLHCTSILLPSFLSSFLSSPGNMNEIIISSISQYIGATRARFYTD